MSTQTEPTHELPGLTLDVADPVVGDGPEPVKGPPPLPGSVLLATTMERRRFLRGASKSFFMGFVAVSSGTAGLLGFLASPAQAAGACCPSCCGPSPCCETACCSKPCCPGNPGDSSSCINNGSTCLGFDNTWGGTACWSCGGGGGQPTTICCDCKTNNETGCSNPYATNRCICYFVGHIAPPPGLAHIRDASQVPTWN
jgi:hypothetical protein